MLLHLCLKNPTINEAEFKTPLFALKRNKGCGYGEVSANIVRGFMTKCTSFSFIFPANISSRCFSRRVENS